jgi:hypothetical protein
VDVRFQNTVYTRKAIRYEGYPAAHLDIDINCDKGTRPGLGLSAISMTQVGKPEPVGNDRNAQRWLQRSAQM